jgi:hypothetical protein
MQAFLNRPAERNEDLIQSVHGLRSPWGIPARVGATESVRLAQTFH